MVCALSAVAPWKRVVEINKIAPGHQSPKDRDVDIVNSLMYRGGHHNDGLKAIVEKKSNGWSPTCACNAGEPVPATVLDQFSGAGTTVMVALRLGRNGIGIELNHKYAEMSRERIINDCPMLNSQ